MSDTPEPSGEPSEPCPNCAFPVNAEILADTPDCPHGWVSFEGMAMADIKAIFAEHDDVLSLDPECTGDTK